MREEGRGMNLPVWHIHNEQLELQHCVTYHQSLEEGIYDLLTRRSSVCREVCQAGRETERRDGEQVPD